jgi:hypothetical protein
LFKNVQSGLFNYTVLDSFYFLPILKHTEGFSSESYKDFLMPLLFPTGSESKSARIIDFSNFYNNLKKITENSNFGLEYLSKNKISRLFEKKKYTKNIKTFRETHYGDSSYSSNSIRKNINSKYYLYGHKLSSISGFGSSFSSGKLNYSNYYKKYKKPILINNIYNNSITFDAKFKNNGFGKNYFNFSGLFDKNNIGNCEDFGYSGITRLSLNNLDIKNYNNLFNSNKQFSDFRLYGKKKKIRVGKLSIVRKEDFYTNVDNELSLFNKSRNDTLANNGGGLNSFLKIKYM